MPLPTPTRPKNQLGFAIVVVGLVILVALAVYGLGVLQAGLA